MIGDNDSFSEVFIHRFGSKNGIALSRKAVGVKKPKRLFGRSLVGA